VVQKSIVAVAAVATGGLAVPLLAAAEAGYEIYHAAQDANKDAVMVETALSRMADALNATQDVYWNYTSGVAQVLAPEAGPQTPDGNIESAVIIGSGPNSAAHVGIRNAGPVEATYQVCLFYYMNNGYRWSEFSDPVQLQPSEARNVQITLLAPDSDPDQEPKPGMVMTYELVAYTDRGAFSVATHLDQYVGLVSHEELGRGAMALRQRSDAPLFLRVSKEAGSLVYWLEITLRSPLTIPTAVALVQQVPSELDVLEPGSATIDGQTLAWHPTLEPDMSTVVSLKVRWATGYGAALEFPGPTIEFYDPRTGAVTMLEGPSWSVPANSGVSASADRPREIMVNNPNMIPAGVANLTEVEASIDITLTIRQLDGTEMLSETQGLVLSPSENRVYDFVFTPGNLEIDETYSWEMRLSCRGLQTTLFYGDVVARSDQDADGIPDYWEEQHDLSPDDPDDALTDGDQDGLDNVEEYHWDAEPFNPDTDGDGVTDGDEVAAGTSPTFALVILAGDSDFDGDVDLDDYASFADCVMGPGSTPAPAPPMTAENCLSAFDLEADGDVDLSDSAVFQRIFMVSP